MQREWKQRGLTINATKQLSISLRSVSVSVQQTIPLKRASSYERHPLVRLNCFCQLFVRFSDAFAIIDAVSFSLRWTQITQRASDFPRSIANEISVIKDETLNGSTSYPYSNERQEGKMKSFIFIFLYYIDACEISSQTRLNFMGLELTRDRTGESKFYGNQEMRYVIDQWEKFLKFQNRYFEVTTRKNIVSDILLELKYIFGTQRNLILNRL